MRLLDAQVLDGELLLVLHGSPAAMFSAKAGINHSLGCGVHLVTPGMMSRICISKGSRANQHRVPRARRHHRHHRRQRSTEAPVVVRRRDVMNGAAIFRGTRVPPGPVFSILADKSATEIVPIDYLSLSTDLLRSALWQACRLLEREAPWVDR